ncbi:hypothetical protein HBI25_015300 [Parastagonospora nodorum]|nr:hypothetical protein HBH53_018930 [Parastagonospora nodorum]KAH3965446.1 hypothetical protein HBH51_153000 [Parastagonospora nodorum]KAH3977204.1 hypothetical protein HBH52_113340 [Parastagonospora nodorum]KAH3999916.1 hypothetical protein HBI10_108420 [Parastagonospora nodorum]KAH4022295.1 hypothetical protein HBI13_100770 [Parastagonospora nodorum]
MRGADVLARNTPRCARAMSDPTKMVTETAKRNTSTVTTSRTSSFGSKRNSFSCYYKFEMYYVSTQNQGRTRQSNPFQVRQKQEVYNAKHTAQMR